MELRIDVTGMRCAHCVDSVTAAVARLDGVRVCDASVGAVRVVLDDSITKKSDLFEAIRSAGSFNVESFSVLSQGC